MAIVYSYPTAVPELQDLLIGTEMAAQGGEDAPRTKTFTIGSIVDLANGGVVGPEGPQGPTGAQGIQGFTGTAGAVGPAGLEWKGAWTPMMSYIEDDAVGWDGASWFCILASTGSTVPSLDPTHWALLASRGAQGIQGVQGPTGAQGASGGAGTLQQTVDNGNTVTDSFTGDTTTLFAGGVLVSNAFGNSALNPYELQFKNGTYFSYLQHPGTFTANRTYTLPNASGTIALTSDITSTNATKVIKTTITSAQILNLFTTPIIVLNAFTPNLKYPINIYIRRNIGNGYTLANNMFSIVDEANVVVENSIDASFLAFNYSSSTGFTQKSLSIDVGSGNEDRRYLYKLKANIGNPTLGTGDLDVYVTYIEITL